MICGLELVTRGFEFLIRGSELLTPGFELAFFEFQFVLLSFQLVLLSFQLVTRNSCFTISREKDVFKNSCSEIRKNSQLTIITRPFFLNVYRYRHSSSTQGCLKQA